MTSRVDLMGNLASGGVLGAYSPASRYQHEIHCKSLGHESCQTEIPGT